MTAVERRADEVGFEMLLTLEKALPADIAEKHLLHHVLRVGGRARSVERNAVDHRRVVFDDFAAALRV